ncbi:HepT-like ribonuclease domain-containing protein [Lentibacillus sp. N15]|uniref:HepT-like ribonuclease domain-containing protein n=1 Tax=Lentibacillus songyuanensis TaxID=3136161 RepID=UPI0031BB7ADE
MGEAANKIPKELRDKYPEVPWRKMSDLRNLLIHEYFGIDFSIVWVVATQNIPEIKPYLMKIIIDDR